MTPFLDSSFIKDSFSAEFLVFFFWKNNNKIKCSIQLIQFYGKKN